MLQQTPARYLTSPLALSASDRAFYINQAKTILARLRSERLYAYAVYQQSAGRRRTVMAALRVCENNRRLVQGGRGAYMPSRWGHVPSSRWDEPDDCLARASDYGGNRLDRSRAWMPRELGAK